MKRIHEIVSYYLHVVLFYLLRVFPINKKKIVFSSFLGKGYSDNPKYVSEYILRNYPDYKIIWLTSSPDYSFPFRVMPVRINSLSSYYHLVTAKAWVDNCRKLEYYRKRKKQIYMQTWHGGLGIKKIEGDCISIDERYIQSAKNDSGMIDVILSNSDHLTRIYKNAFWYNGEILQIGMPKNDCLIRDIGEDSVKVKRKLGFREGQRICLYAPTFRDANDEKVFEIDVSGIKKALHNRFSGEWEVIVRYHPNTMSRINTSKINSDALDVSQYEDTQELLIASDCLITDYSSIIFDFMLTKKPAFIFAKDYSDYLTKERGVYFKLNELPFSIADSDKQLEANIAGFSKVEYQTQIGKFMELTNCLETGKASQIAADYLINKMKKRKRE